MARCTSSSVATPTTVEYSDSSSIVGSLRRSRPASISRSRKASARSTTGATWVARRSADSEPGRVTSRTRPSSSAWATAVRKTRRTIASTWAKPCRPRDASCSKTLARSSAAASITASKSACLDGK